MIKGGICSRNGQEMVVTEGLNPPESHEPPPSQLHDEIVAAVEVVPAAEIPAKTMKIAATIWLEEGFAWLKALTSAALYATLIVTFLFQVARVEGWSMAPTLAD